MKLMISDLDDFDTQLTNLGHIYIPRENRWNGF